MRFVLAAMVLFVAGTARAADPPGRELPPFPEELQLDLDFDPEVTVLEGVPHLVLGVDYVATLRGRTEWALEQWRIERGLRFDIAAIYQESTAELKSTLIEGYEARLALLREYADGLEERAKEDAVTIDKLRNPMWFKSKGFIYGLGISTALVAVVAGGVLARR